MDLEYSWNVTLVVFTLLTIVLVVATSLIVAVLVRENRMFHKRLIRKSNKIQIQNEENIIDISGLKELIKGNLDEKKTDKILEIQNYFIQLEQKYKVKQMDEKIIKRKILEKIRIQFVEHPMDMEGLRLSHLAGRLFLMYLNKHGQQFSKTSISKLFPQKRSKCWGFFTKILGVFLLLSIWIFVTVMDIMFICEFKTILIPQVFNNETMVSYQTSTVDLHFSLMVAHYLMYFTFLCKLALISWRRSKSNEFLDKILHRLLFLIPNNKNTFALDMK